MRGYPRYDCAAAPRWVHFPQQNPLFSSLEGTKPCISFGKRTLGPHGPPMGRYWSKPSVIRSAPCTHQIVQNAVQTRRIPEVTLGRGAPLGPIFHCKIHYFRPWRVQNHAFPVQNVHLGHIAPPSVSPGAYKTMHLLYLPHPLGRLCMSYIIHVAI